MTRLEEAIETLKSLSLADQEFYADWVLSAHKKNLDHYELSTDELAELDRRLESNEETVPAAVVFARLYDKYAA